MITFCPLNLWGEIIRESGTSYLSLVSKYNEDILKTIKTDGDTVKLITRVREVARKYGFEHKF